MTENSNINEGYEQKRQDIGNYVLECLPITFHIREAQECHGLFVDMISDLHPAFFPPTLNNINGRASNCFENAPRILQILADLMSINCTSEEKEANINETSYPSFNEVDHRKFWDKQLVSMNSRLQIENLYPSLQEKTDPSLTQLTDDQVNNLSIQTALLK